MLLVMVLLCRLGCFGCFRFRVRFSLCISRFCISLCECKVVSLQLFCGQCVFYLLIVCGSSDSVRVGVVLMCRLWFGWCCRFCVRCCIVCRLLLSLVILCFSFSVFGVVSSLLCICKNSGKFSCCLVCCRILFIVGWDICSNCVVLLIELVWWIVWNILIWWSFIGVIL